MTVLITGGSGSGKSAYAEEYITRLAKDNKKYYIATMQVFDKEGQERVERHRKQRSGKGFLTIEQPTDIGAAFEKMEKFPEKENAVLLECISNLVANEMFSGEVRQDCKTVEEKIIRGIERVKNGLKHFVIVTNNVFEDGITYEEATMEYIRTMGKINEALAVMADQVVEVVVGIPVVIKEGNRLKNMLDSLFFNRQFESEPQICHDRSREFEILGACHRSKLL